jgi:Cof subfamily protein (haloacid dehalogenase superfamily)
VEAARSEIREPALLACDVDGTIVGARRSPTAATLAAIATVRRAGTTIVLASGRMPTALVGLCRSLDLQGPQITMQGGHVASPATGEVVASWRLAPAEVEAHLAFARARGVPVLLYYPDRIRAEEFDQEIADLTVVFDEPIPDVVGDLRAFADSQPVKTFFVTGRERHDAIAADAREAFGHQAAITWGDDRSVELLPLGVSKGAALRVVAGALGVALETVAAVGDGVNDIEMFRVAGRSVAIGHAPPDVRAAATITLPVVDDPFPLAIERLFPSLAPLAPV